MANLKETSFWEEGIYQWETSDPVLGGENGIDNVPTRQLANRTKWLKDNKLDKTAIAANAELAKRANIADRLSDARKVGGIAFDGSADIDLPGVNRLGNQDTTGNANTAFRLKIARTINGVPFDGSADINATPAGAVMYFARECAPTGWLKANGAAVSRTVYEGLFAVLGTYYGAGDGETTFNLPDLRGEFIRAYDDGRGVDQGRSLGRWQTGTPISHDDPVGVHVFDIVTMDYSAREFGDPWIGDLPKAFYSEPYSYQRQACSRNFFTMTRPRNIALLACIKI
ncbi:Phage tail fiber protein [Snodgrassella communis]|uniref:phage tail protein n=1 Tax=Snodgrassella communis TaxID=2946699 RepID=UPI00046142DF|nr:phage tail protein [Snodgrassella communis]KDN11862.1 Phage tail fiber protein [Snodgrassella communis]